MVIGLSIILIITSIAMVLLVLLHKGKGGGLSDLFGGGVSSTLGSSSVVERNLDRITIFFGILWFICVIALNWVINRLAGQPVHLSRAEVLLDSTMVFKG
jgi:preprotein translocase subunit SecG